MSSKIEGGPPPAVRAADLAATASARRAGGDRSAPVVAAAQSDSLRLTGDAAGLQALERELGAAPAGVDVARVNQVKAALADGSYRIDPQQIATRMLALESELAG